MKPSKWIGIKIDDIKRKDFRASPKIERPDYVCAIEAIVMYLDEQYEEEREDDNTERA